MPISNNSLVPPQARVMRRLLHGILVSVCISMVVAGAVHAEPAQLTEKEIRAQFFKGCIDSARDENEYYNKYNAYKACIGKLTRACWENPETFEDALKDISVGPISRGCVEKESIEWANLFKSASQDLKENARLHLKDKRIVSALHETIAELEKRALRECDYVTVRWGYRDGSDLVNIAGLDDGFKCSRDMDAEAAITVYLWNKQLKAQEDIND
jgi:hypothetical protein